MARRNNRKLDEETSYWLSYSDMMAGLLLVFVLIIAFTMLHSKVQYDEKQAELISKEEALVIKSDELESQQALVAEQKALLSEQEALLTKQEDALSLQKTKLEEAEEQLRTQHSLLDELQKLMAEQQDKLDNIIGVRSELVEALKAEFQSSSLKIAIDEQTGAITFDSSILFEYNKDEIKESGKKFLSEFLPRYANILLSDKYKDYVSEIMIVGHTDTSGTYLFNLDLSQKRAYRVAEYCLADDNEFLTDEQLEALRKVASVNGKSYSNPVLKADGTIDMAASRRVEFMFRLSDEEMIREMIDILNTEQNSGVTTTIISNNPY